METHLGFRLLQASDGNNLKLVILIAIRARVPSWQRRAFPALSASVQEKILMTTDELDAVMRAAGIALPTRQKIHNSLIRAKADDGEDTATAHLPRASAVSKALLAASGIVSRRTLRRHCEKRFD